jgi:hypothetical protein
MKAGGLRRFWSSMVLTPSVHEIRIRDGFQLHHHGYVHVEPIGVWLGWLVGWYGG